MAEGIERLPVVVEIGPALAQIVVADGGQGGGAGVPGRGQLAAGIGVAEQHVRDGGALLLAVVEGGQDGGHVGLRPVDGHRPGGDQHHDGLGIGREHGLDEIALRARQVPVRPIHLFAQDVLAGAHEARWRRRTARASSAAAVDRGLDPRRR